jgi:YhcH/YjgK/YiaL family protein
MIYSSIRTWRKEEQIYTERLHKALTFLENLDPETMDDEKFVLEEGTIFGFVTSVHTEEVGARRPESHGKHIDIQFLIEGREKIGFIRKTDAIKVLSNELEEKDNCFYVNEMDGEIFLDLKPGEFVVLFPEDIHRPQCICGEETAIRKCVIKIRVDGQKQ